MVLVPPQSPDWLALSETDLPVGEALAWANGPGWGGTVLFCGTVRDHAEGRRGVERLDYEAYPEGAEAALAKVATDARRRFPDLGRLALLHRLGALKVGEVAVVVVASAPHRGEAFDAARFCIDTVKQTVPIWKYETWEGGSDWSEDIGA